MVKSLHILFLFLYFPDFGEEAGDGGWYDHSKSDIIFK